MAIAEFVPQDADLAARSADNTPITPRAAVVHDTIGIYTGPDSGDSQYIENHELAHFSIGEDEGEWEQLLDTGVFAAHANGANRYAFGIEFSRLESGMPLTDWQRRCWWRIARWAEQVHDIPLTYVDPESVPDASVWVNAGNFRGWISHRSVKTDDNTAQHTDYIPYADWLDASGTRDALEDDMKVNLFRYAGVPQQTFRLVQLADGRVGRFLVSDHELSTLVAVKAVTFDANGFPDIPTLDATQFDALVECRDLVTTPPSTKG